MIAKAPQPYKPHPYQKHAIEFIIDKGAAGLFLDPGLGKTSIVLAAFKILRNKNLLPSRRMLVVAPLRPAYSTWPGEARKWAAFNDLKVVVLHGDNKLEKLKEPADVHVINPEGLEWLARNIPRKSPREPWPWDLLVIDESTKFKHTNTVRFKTLKPLLPEFRRRVILTGSPAPNGLLDLFGQVFILDLGNSLGKHITQYRETYFRNPGQGRFDKYVWIPKEGSDKAIHKKLKPLVLRMAAEDHLNLDPYIPNTVEIDLPAKAQRQYKQMESALITSLANGEVITAANAAAATTKCRQIANGGIYHEGTKDRRWADLHMEKVEAVAEIVESLQGKPALIAYEYQHDLNRLLLKFGKDTPVIGGGVPPKKFREIEQRWNAGEIPILLAQPQSVAHGLNLQEVGAAVIWHSLTYNLEDYEQFIRRVWRQGQKERIVVHHIVARGTVDRAIMNALEKKDRTQKTLLAALKDHLKVKQRRAA